MYLPDLHTEFLNYLEIERNYSPHTIAAYRSDFRAFLAYLAEQGEVGPTVASVDRPTVRGYIAWLRTRGLAPASAVRHVNSLRAFWGYLRDESRTQADPFVRISIPKLPSRPPRALSAQEAQGLLDAAEQQHCVFSAFRDKAILSLLIFGGLRRNEIIRLQLHDLDLNAATVTVVSGKGAKGRLIPLSAGAQDAVRDWVELRPTNCSHDHLFTSKWGAPLSKNGLMSCLQRALARADIRAEGVTLHTLRHTFATLMLQGGCDLYSLQQLLGHSRLDTTATYLHAGLANLRQALSCHPLIGDNGDERDLSARNQTC